MKLIFSIILLIISLASCKGPDADSERDVPVTGRIDYHEYSPGDDDDTGLRAGARKIKIT